MDAATGLCLSCLRTLEEITEWRDMDRETRLAVMAALPARKAASTPQRSRERARPDA